MLDRRFHGYDRLCQGWRVALATAAVLVLAVDIAGAAKPDPWQVYPGKLPDRANALRWNIEACVAACRQHADPATKQIWSAQCDGIGRELRKGIGLEPLPAKSPLNAQITGRADRDGYTIENLLFQSLPHFYVTANVYIPKAASRPLPAVIVTAGHAIEDGKNYDVYRTAQLDLVRQGFVVLAYDPIGQGERKVRGNGHVVSYAAMLVGHTNLRYMLWDSMRALDYLLTRPEVDPKRIAITGNSGGGLNTMYAMPLEPRFAAGAAFCCPCSFEAWIRDGGNHCICNHVPGICRQMEQFQFVGLSAPRPFLMGGGQKDHTFPIEGTRDTLRRAREIYGFFNASDRIALVEAPLPHGWAQPLREATCSWFDRWLQKRGDGAGVSELKVSLEERKSQDLRVLKSGRMPDDAQTYVDLIRQEAEHQMQSQVPPSGDKTARVAWAERVRRGLWEVLGGQPSGFAPRAEMLGHVDWEGQTAERVAVQSEPTLEVPAILIRPKKSRQRAAAVLLLSDGGKTAWRSDPVTRRLLDQGITILAMDVRALGEGKVHDNQCASDAIVLGRPLLAQQVWDVMCAARVLAARGDVDGRRVAVYGRGQIGLVALVAASLSDDLAAVIAEGTTSSLLDAIADPLPEPLWWYAPNMLKVADLPQLLAVLAPKPLLWLNPARASGKPISREALQSRFALVAEAYRASGFGDRGQAAIAENPSQQAFDFLKATLAPVR